MAAALAVLACVVLTQQARKRPAATVPATGSRRLPAAVLMRTEPPSALVWPRGKRWSAVFEQAPMGVA
jgi:hypothetical protein